MTSSLFKENPYYHQSIRKLIVAFGSLFTDITIEKHVGGNKAQTVLVPIAYGPKNKWLSRLHEDPDLKNNVEITLPRIAFEIVGYRYDASRKIGAQGNYLASTIGDSRAKLFNPVPYDIEIALVTMCKNQEDSLQVLEQILPYFAPSMTVSIEILPVFSIKKDIPIVLQGVSVQDSFEGSPQDFRTVIQTLTFVAQMDLFGPINTSKKIIKTAIADVGFNPNKSPLLLTDNDANRFKAAVNPQAANKEDPHTVDETWFGEF